MFFLRVQVLFCANEGITVQPAADGATICKCTVIYTWNIWMVCKGYHSFMSMSLIERSYGSPYFLLLF